MAMVLREWDWLSLPNSSRHILSAAIQVVDLRTKWARGEFITLFQAIQKTQKSQATIPIDKIFAILGLTVDGSRLLPLPNYQQDIESLLAEMTVEMVKMEKSLDLICLGRIDGSSGGPSWMPSWLDLNKLRNFLTSIVSARRAPRWKNHFPALFDNKGVLHVRAVRIGSILTL